MNLDDLGASLRLRVSCGLEGGTWGGPVARALSRVWGEIGARSLARPLQWRDGLRVIAVGGATLGGSGKTPLAIACARELDVRGSRVAFVAHGYRARPGCARVVRSDDDLAEVGDEAIVAARALAGRVPVVVAPTRQAALDHASTLADIVVLDGVLQTSPRRASLALLALDEGSPWGSGELVPRGDLRAPQEALLQACDHAVVLHDDRVRSRGAFASGRLIPWSELSHVRVGLFLALARPARIVSALARRGVVPSRIVRVPDHGLPPKAILARVAPTPAHPVDLWLATPKCALHLEAAGIPHAVLDHAVEPDPALRRALDSVCVSSRALTPTCAVISQGI
ncbi:MAG: tetraacyldisaccharide 4'-kinase [Polyangiaceae bacterium]